MKVRATGTIALRGWIEWDTESKCWVTEFEDPEHEMTMDGPAEYVGAAKCQQEFARKMMQAFAGYLADYAVTGEVSPLEKPN